MTVVPTGHFNALLSQNMAERLQTEEVGDDQQPKINPKHTIELGNNGFTKTLSMEENEDWYLAIKRNQFEYVKDILTAASTTRRGLLVNGQFVYETADKDTKLTDEEKAKHCEFQLPIFIAAVFGAKETFDLLLQHGADVFATDIGNSNILHALVYSQAFIRTTGQATIFETIVETLTGDTEKLRAMFFSEDQKGMRPLELACDLGTFPMIKRILSVDGVYRFPRSTPSLCREVWYDVTDYEIFGGNSRHSLSPLRFLDNITREQLKDDECVDIFNNPFIESWMHSKIMCNIPEIMIGLMLSLGYHMTFMVINPTRLQSCVESNSTIDNSSVIYVQSSYTTLFSAVVIIHNIICMLRWLISSIRGKGCSIEGWFSSGLVVNSVAERVRKFSLAILWFIFLLISTMGVCTKEFLTLLYIAILLLNLLNFIYCCKMFPVIGHFVIIFNELLYDMYNFMIIFVIVHINLAITMRYSLALLEIYMKDYSNFSSSMYANFKVMLNMINFDKYSLMNWGIVSLLHSIIVIITAVILINLVIAIMSNTVTDIYQNRVQIQKIYRLESALSWQHIIKEPLHMLFKTARIQKFTPGLRFENGRIYVNCFETDASYT